MDIRVQRHAQVLVDYSLKINKGDRFVILGSTIVEPLIKEVYRLGLRRGAFVDVHMVLPGLEWIYYAEASQAQLKYPSPFYKLAWEGFNKVLFIHGGHNTRALAGVPVEKIQTKIKACKTINANFMKRSDLGVMSWCLTMHPTLAQAQEANMSLERFEDFLYGACFCNYANPVVQWKKLFLNQEKLARRLNRVKAIHIKAPDTDIRFKTAGRWWCNCHGKTNMPDGEVFTGPIENSAEGHIRFSFPGIYMSQEIENIFLEFKKGRIVKASAVKGQDLLEKLISTDEGSHRVGELAIGTNYGIKDFTKNILFDEKLGGTIHVAIGHGYPKDTGSKSKSVVHWDMIADMKKGGKIFADDVLIYENGRFVKGWG